jgi:hypothetical protein
MTVAALRDFSECDANKIMIDVAPRPHKPNEAPPQTDEVYRLARVV